MAEHRSSQSNSSPPISERNVITLVKGDDRWRFHLEAGLEHEIIDAVSAMAADPAHALDWFDAAIVSHQVTRHLETQTTPGKNPGTNSQGPIPPGGACEAA